MGRIAARNGRGDVEVARRTAAARELGGGVLVVLACLAAGCRGTDAPDAPPSSAVVSPGSAPSSERPATDQPVGLPVSDPSSSSASAPAQAPTADAAAPMAADPLTPLAPCGQDASAATTSAATTKPGAPAAEAASAAARRDGTGTDGTATGADAPLDLLTAGVAPCGSSSATPAPPAPSDQPAASRPRPRR